VNKICGIMDKKGCKSMKKSLEEEIEEVIDGR